MQINFYDSEYQVSTTQTLFGLCDDLDLVEKTPAYIDFENFENWICKVKNDTTNEIVFTAIDHGLIKNSREIDNPERCDVMLNNHSTIIFVELKNREKKTAKISQLENTIHLFNLNHDLDIYSVKKAVLSNKKCIATLKQETKENFPKNNFGFRVYFTNEIIV
jgi:hypothetical protein